MYGTIARMKVKPGMMDAFIAWGEQRDRPDDGSATLVFRSDNDPNELFLVVAARSREEYRAQSESPEMHEQFLEMMQFLAAEPEWHDGEVIEAHL